MPHRSQTSARLPYNRAEAVAALSAADPKLAALIARAGPFTMRLAATQSPFEALTESIIYQQLHGKAAATIHARLLSSFEPLCGLSPTGEPAHPSPQHILDCPTPQLRAAGLSHNKILALRDLAAKTLGSPGQASTVPSLAKIRRMDDQAIIDHLTQVRGIGIWTVQMMLIFRLGRPDVLPTTDYGIRKGFALTFQGLSPTTKVTADLLATPADIEHRARKWTPWRSVASWYLWRACDLAKPTSHT
jgi:DNA-3-methyladenine glycosylase II